MPYSDSKLERKVSIRTPLRSKRATDEEEGTIGRQCGSRRVFVRNTLIEEIDLLGNYVYLTVVRIRYRRFFELSLE